MMSRRRASCSEPMSPRSGRPKIARQFIGGFAVIIKDPSPRSGRKNFLQRERTADLTRPSGDCAQQSLGPFRCCHILVILAEADSVVRFADLFSKFASLSQR